MNNATSPTQRSSGPTTAGLIGLLLQYRRRRCRPLSYNVGPTRMRIHLADDSGILGLLDCSAYSPFIGEDWNYEQLLSHCRSQAMSKSIVVWDAGDGGNNYRIDVHLEGTDAKGHREARSQITVKSGCLHLASYTALTMAAQYAAERLPAKTEAECSVPLPDGEYAVRVIQMYNPSRYDEPSGEDPHFIIEILRSSREIHGNVLWL